MSKITEAARGQPCLVRLEDVCVSGGANETTVASHYRLRGLSGEALKPIDIISAHACFRCHDVVDGRDKRGARMIDAQFGEHYRRLAHAEGVLRTLDALMRAGWRIVPPT